MEKIRIATIGSSHITDSFIAGAGHDPRFRLEAVYSRSAEKGAAFAAKYGVGKVYTSLEDLAADRSVDAVYIASPNALHAPQAIYLMDRGKSVLVEKPAAVSPEEFCRMADAAVKNRVSLMEAMKTTLLPNFAAVERALPRIGKIRRYSASYCQYSSRYDGFRRGVVATNMDPAMHGGARLDLGVYCIAPMVHLFGAPWEGEFTREKLESCVLSQQTIVYPGGDTLRERGIDGQGSMLIKYPDGMEANLTWSKISDSALPAEIQGEDGTILIERIQQMAGPRIVMRVGSGTRGDAGFKNGGSGIQSASSAESLEVETIADNMYYEAREFFDLVENGLTESAVNTFERSLIRAQICSR